MVSVTLRLSIKLTCTPRSKFLIRNPRRTPVLEKTVRSIQDVQNKGLSLITFPQPDFNSKSKVFCLNRTSCQALGQSGTPSKPAPLYSPPASTLLFQQALEALVLSVLLEPRTTARPIPVAHTGACLDSGHPPHTSWISYSHNERLPLLKHCHVNVAITESHPTSIEPQEFLTLWSGK